MANARLNTDYQKFQKAAALFLRSAARVPALRLEIVDDAIAMEPYDALTSRFERCVEVFLGKYLRSLEFHLMGAAFPTVRDRLQFGLKIGLLTDAEIWLEMREFRNRMAHDYLPDKLVEMFEALRGRFALEVKSVADAAMQNSAWRD